MILFPSSSKFFDAGTATGFPRSYLGLHRVELLNAATAASDVCKPVSIFHPAGLFFHPYPGSSLYSLLGLLHLHGTCHVLTGLVCSVQLSIIQIYCNSAKSSVGDTGSAPALHKLIHISVSL